MQGTTTYYDTGAESLVGDDGHATRVLITLAGDDQDAKTEACEAVAHRLDADGLESHVGGTWAVYGDVNDQVAHDIARAEAISLPLVFLLSLVVFGSVAAALMPTLVGGIAVLGAFAVMRALTAVTDISIFAINVITLLGMGLAIDYALFVITRFREELARQPDTGRASVHRATTTAVATAGRTVLFFGLIVAASLGSLLVFPQTFLRSMGLGGAAAVLVAMGAALTLLPAILTLLGPRVEWGRMPWRRSLHTRATDHVAAGTGGWARLAHSVMRRAVAYLVVVAAGLLALAAPFTGAQFGSIDERVLPASSPSRQAADAAADWFGAAEASAQVVLVGVTPEATRAQAERLAELPGVLSVTPGGTATVDGAPSALLTVSWPGESQTTASQDMVRELRAIPAPEGATRYVTGQSAATVDLITSIGDRLWAMGAIVAAIMLVMLFLAFGSIVLPVKAIAVGVLSITASFGVVTWIFQEGNLSGLLGFTAPGYLDATQPILMLAILFGLSMDYEVFLLSRVREEWDRTHDNALAVATGLQRTGGIITAAALLLATVISGFTTSGIVFLKMIGVGMLIAVLLDATVVRALLVPAIMRLLGRANWWAPGPMQRWWERHGIREEPAAAPAAVGGPQTAREPAGSATGR